MGMTMEEMVTFVDNLHPDGCGYVDVHKDILIKLLTTTAQRVRADWLRSEIEKLERDIWSEEEKILEGYPLLYIQARNNALTSIITRYKEELLELEKGV